MSPQRVSALVGSTHCGAGCAIGDFIGVWLVFVTGLVLLGSTLFTHYLAAFLLAYAFGIFFQYFSIAPMRGLGLAMTLPANWWLIRRGVKEAM